MSSERPERAAERWGAEGATVGGSTQRRETFEHLNHRVKCEHCSGHANWKTADWTGKPDVIQPYTVCEKLTSRAAPQAGEKQGDKTTHSTDTNQSKVH